MISVTRTVTIFSTLALGLIILACPAHSQEGPPKIADIIILGNKVLNREYILITSGLKVGDPVTQANLDEAKRKLLQTGNFGMHKTNPNDGVTIKSEFMEKEKSAKVVVDVDENDKILGITISGSGPIKPDVVQSKMATKVGDVLNLPLLQRDVETIQKLYDEKGYQAFVSEDVGIKDGILNIPIVIGRINSVTVKGLKKTKTFVVTRELEHSRKGSLYNVNQLKKDLTNLYNTDLFESVEPTFSFPSPGKLDLNLNVQEKRSGQVELAVGYGSRGLVGRAGVSENNFLGRGQQASFFWETGGRANRNSFELAFTEPWLDHKHTSVSASVFDKTVYRFSQRVGSIGDPNFVDQSGVYFETHQGGQLTVSRPFSQAFRAFVGIRYDDVNVPLIPLDIQDQPALQKGPLSVLNLRVTHNTRDFDLEPAAGGYEVYTGDIGHAKISPIIDFNGLPTVGIFGDLNYTRFGFDARRYFSPQGRRTTPKDKRSVFALRLMYGGSAGVLPFSEQYFVGGAESLRGYNEDRFWGFNMFLASTEYRHPLAPSLTGVFFVDAGDAWGGRYQGVRLSGFNQHTGFSPSVGIGLGLRVVTPIGPIRIDEGFGREGAHTHFSIGHAF